MDDIDLKSNRVAISKEKLHELNKSQSRIIEALSELSKNNQKGINVNTESIKLLKEMVSQNNDAINEIVSHIKTLYGSLP